MLTLELQKLKEFHLFYFALFYNNVFIKGKLKSIFRSFSELRSKYEDDPKELKMHTYFYELIIEKLGTLSSEKLEGLLEPLAF